MGGVVTLIRKDTFKQGILKMGKLFTNEKENKRAIKAAVDQANRVRVNCAGCGYTPKPDEWSTQNKNYCFDCA